MSYFRYAYTTNWQIGNLKYFFFSFAYTTSPAAVMELVVFFRSSKPPYNFWWSGVADGHFVRFALVGVCNISEEHARLSGPPHQRDTLAKERFLVSCACVRWACCGRNAVVPKSPGREEGDQEGGMHPSPVWVSALFWWWWSFPGNWCWLMVAPHYTWLVNIDAGQVDIWKSVVQFSSFLL